MIMAHFHTYKVIIANLPTPGVGEKKRCKWKKKHSIVREKDSQAMGSPLVAGNEPVKPVAVELTPTHVVTPRVSE